MSTLLAGMDGIVEIITGTLGMIIYPLFSIIFVAISAVQQIFEAFAGIGEMSFAGTPIGNANDGSETGTGIVFYILNNNLVKNTMVSILVLAIFLIVIFTAMAFIKNSYSTKPKGWKDIIALSIKGLWNFMFIPVCCLLGVWLGNILLQAINGATTPEGATYMHRKLFIASAYNANLYRLDEASGPAVAREAYNRAYGGGGESAVPDGLSDEEYADIVDRVYSQSEIDLSLWGNVDNQYSLWQINYIVLVVGGIFILYVLGSMAFAMVRRLFIIVILYAVSPGICAMYPIDEGKALGSWKDEFIKQVCSAYGAVAALNIFFSLVPLIDRLELQLSGIPLWGINDLVQIFILTCGLMVVKELIGTFSGWFKGEDVLSKGSSYMKDSKAKVLAGTKKAGKVAGMFARPVAGIAKGAWGAAKTAGSALGSVGKGFGKGLSVVGDGLGKAKNFISNKIDQAKLHRYAKKHGWGEKKDGKFQYMDMVGNSINDDFIRDQMATDAWGKK